MRANILCKGMCTQIHRNNANLVNTIFMVISQMVLKGMKKYFMEAIKYDVTIGSLIFLIWTASNTKNSCLSTTLPLLFSR